MDENKVDNEITRVLKKFKDLNSAYEEGKQALKELNEFISLLREEVKLARDAERTAEFKKNRCQGFVNQQQEVILKLLSVKEDNGNLRCTMKRMEKNISDMQNSSMADRVKKDAEINTIKQDYLKELIKIQEAADEQVGKIKAELASKMEDLQKTITEKEETIEQQSNSIFSLEAELKESTDRGEVNLNTYQKKLAEQERKHQAELETWKVAELNQTACQQGYITNTLAHHGSGTLLASNHYPPSSLTKQMNDYQYNLSMQQHQSKHMYSNIPSNSSNPPLQSYQHQPFISRSRNILPGVVLPMSRPLINSVQKSSDFLSAHEIYVQNQNLLEENEEAINVNSSERAKENQTVHSQKQKVLVPNKKRKLYNSNQNLL